MASEAAWHADIEQLVLWIFRALVDSPDRVQVESIETDIGIKFLVTLAQPDMRMAIGKDGQTAKAIRTVLSGIAKAAKVRGPGARYTLEIVTKD